MEVGASSWQRVAFMRSLRLRVLRLSIALGLGLGLAVPGTAGAADGPPYSDGSIPDAIESCLGSPYDIVERDGDLYVRCLEVVSNDWRVFTTGASLTPTAATITISRAHARGRALISYETQAGTATPDVDYLTTSGRVYFADHQSTATVSVPLPVIPPPPGTPARAFTVTFGDPVGLGLTVPTATVELPGVPVSPDPGYPAGPPYGSGPLDGDHACDGGAYEIAQVRGDRYVRCLAGGGNAWQRFSATATVSGGTATVTVIRDDGVGAPALVEFRTVPGTAEAGTDFTPLEGELFFRAGVTTRTLQIPVVRRPGATADRRFELTLGDPLGLSLTLPAPTTVTIPADPAPPTITAAPAAQSVLSAPSFGFTGEAGASFECRLDEQVFAACTSPRKYTGVAPGQHRFEVRQRASHGGVSAPRAHEWTVLPSPDPGFPVGPPYGPSRDPDADYICDGGFYSLITHNVDRYARCLGAVGKPWQTFTSTVVLGESTATVTITREQAYAPVLIGFATEADSAQAGRDFTPISGELYFSESTTSRTVTVPIVRDPQASSDRRFALRLTDPVNLRLTLPATSVTIPGHPPTEIAPPALGGTARVDEHLSATEGEWTHAPTGFAYAWLRCDADGASCVPIPDATDAEYPPEEADVGARLRVEVTASNGSGSAVARSAPSAVVRAALAAPQITAGPSGAQILHRTAFGFTGETGATFECRLDDEPFAPCTSPRNLTQLPSGERRFEVRQRATDGVVSAAAVREWTVLPSPDPGYPLAPPYGHVNDAFSACRGGAFEMPSHNGDRFVLCLGDPGVLSWQRFAATVDLTGTTATVTVTREAGDSATVLRFATEDGSAAAGDDYEARTGELYFARNVTSRTVDIPVVRDPDATSDRTFRVQVRDFLGLNLRVEDVTVTIPGNAPTATAAPAIAGVARVGQALSATDGDWTHEPTGYVRAWERCDASGDGCVPIADATAATYEPVAADAGSRLRVAVSATNGSGTTLARSAPTAVIRPVLGAPTVSGGPEGETEQTSATFALAGEDGATFECRRDDDEFVACTSPVTYDGLAVGAHEVAVRQVADDGVTSDEAIRRWTVVAPEPGGEPGGEEPPGPGPGEQPPGPGPGDRPPFVLEPLPPSPPAGDPPSKPAPSRGPVRMVTIRMELRFCAGCSRPSARDRKRLQRLRARVSGSRLLAIDGYGDPGRTRVQNRRLARSRARAVERILVSGLERRPARRTVAGHDRLTRVDTAKKASATRKGSVARTVTIRVVRRR
jgi:hypothetical protein